MNKEPRVAPITYKPNKWVKVVSVVGILIVSVAIIIVPNLFECNGTDKCKCLHYIISLIIAVAVICLFSFFVLREEKEDIRFAKIKELVNLRSVDKFFPFIESKSTDCEITEENVKDEGNTEQAIKIITKKNIPNVDIAKTYINAIVDL